MLILAVSFGMGLGVLLVPEIVTTLSANIGGTFGKIIGSVLGSSITAGGLSAIVLSLFLGDYPEKEDAFAKDFPLDKEEELISSLAK